MTKSLIDSACPDCVKRVIGTGLAWFFDDHERHGVFADAEAQGPHWAGLATDMGFRSFFGPNRNLQLAGSLRFEDLNKNRMVHLGGGIVFQQYFFSALVSVRYALYGLPVTGGKGEAPMHQISLGLVWDAFADRVEPRPFLRASHARLSPTGAESLPRSVDFLLRAEEESGKMGNWSLVIFHAGADLRPTDLVRRYQGRGFPPKNIAWALDDVAGNPCETGMYAYRLVVEDAAGNSNWTEWQNLELR